VPVHYRALIRKKDVVQAEGKAAWLGYLLQVPVVFQDGELSVKIKVLGITVKDLVRDEKELQRDRERVTEEAGKVSPPVNEAVNCREGEAQTTAKERVPEQKSNGFLKKIRGFFWKIKNLKYTIRKFCVKIKSTVEKVGNTKEFVLDELTRTALSFFLGQVLVLIKKISPKKVKGEIRFGTSDPALTGQILGGISIFYPFFMDNVKVIPDFEKACLEGELFVKGRLRMVTAMGIAFKLFRDKNLRFVYQKLNAEE